MSRLFPLRHASLASCGIAMVLADAVRNLVDQVLAGLAEGIRDKCDRAEILAALNELDYATTMDNLREHMLAAPEDLNKALGDVAPAFFIARFQKAVTESSGEPQAARAGSDPLAEPVSTSEVAVSTVSKPPPLWKRIRPGMQIAGVRDVVNKFTAKVTLTIEPGGASTATVTQSTEDGVPEAMSAKCSGLCTLGALLEAVVAAINETVGWQTGTETAEAWNDTVALLLAGCPYEDNPNPDPNPNPNPNPNPDPDPDPDPNPNPNPNPNQVARTRRSTRR